MAKLHNWIIVKRLDQTLAWNYDDGWDTAEKATVFYNQNYLLPQGGMWREIFNVVDTPNDWSEGDLITTTH